MKPFIIRKERVSSQTEIIVVKREANVHHWVCALAARMGFSEEDILTVDFEMASADAGDQNHALENNSYLISVVVGTETVHILTHIKDASGGRRLRKMLADVSGSQFK